MSLKGKVLFNAVFTTVKVKESSIVTLDNNQAFILPDQEVVSVGSHVSEIKVGDTVLINVEKMEKKVPVVTINGEDYLSLTERDIIYVYDSSEIVNEEIPS